MNILNKVILENGTTLILKKAMPEESKEIVKYLNAVGGESDNLLFGENEFRLNEKQEAEHISNLNKNPNCLMMLGTIDNEIVSISLITTVNRNRIVHNGDLSISVRKSHWNLGIASEVMKELIKFAKTNNTIKTIRLGVKSDNINAIKLYTKFGFEKVGLHKNYFNINGNFYDEILMDLYL